MANLTFDFLHNYVTGERRASDPADAYQYDEGHVLEAVVPVAVTSCEIQYWIRGMEKADAYTPTSITQNTDNTYTILGNIPNSYFETNGDLRVYIVVTDGNASITTYEGYIHIKERQMPEDYVDDDPDNDAVQIIAAARGYAETSEAWAVGQINGEDVPSTADQYQNNASYYAGQAASAASSAAAQASLAPAYDNTATYAAGDYCLHDGQLYECTTAIATAEAWTAAHWTAVTVGGELSTLKEEFKLFAQSDLYNGVWENATAPTYWNKRICTAKLIKITAGDKFVYSTGVLQIAFGTYAVDLSTNAYVSWHTVNEETEYVFDYDGYFFMQFKKADGSAVTISEYDATCKLYYGQNYTAYATKDLLRDTIGLNPVSLSWTQGGLSTTGETTDNARIRTSEYVLMPDIVHLHPKDGYKVLIYLYDSTYNVLSAGEWQTSGLDTVKTANTVYFRLAFAKTSDASISPSEVATNLAVTYSYADIGERVTKIESEIHPKFGNTYYGISVNNKHGYNSRKILTISYAGSGTLNSIAFYGNYIVAIINGLNLLRIYDKTTKALLHELSIDLGHANNVGLGNKYNESDPIPLLYVEKEDAEGTYNVVRITSEWTTSIIKKYTFPSDTYGHYPQVTWNFEDGVCYSIGYKANSLVDSNACIFVRSNLNEEALNEDGSYTPQKMFSCEMQKLKYIQDSKYFNGLIYLAHSTATDSSAVSHILMVDTSGGNIVSRIPAPFSGEIEGVALYEDNGEIKMCTTTYLDFYEMVFA